jgi:hypothetical protein
MIQVGLLNANVLSLLIFRGSYFPRLRPEMFHTGAGSFSADSHCPLSSLQVEIFLTTFKASLLLSVAFLPCPWWGITVSAEEEFKTAVKFT